MYLLYLSTFFSQCSKIINFEERPLFSSPAILAQSNQALVDIELINIRFSVRAPVSVLVQCHKEVSGMSDKAARRQDVELGNYEGGQDDQDVGSNIFPSL